MRRLGLLLLLVILAGCAPEPDPVPRPTDLPRPLGETVYTSYLPAVSGFGNCPEPSDKIAIALAGARSDSRPPQLPPPLGWLCIEELVFHRWQCDPLKAGEPVVDGLEIPLVWGLDKNGYDYLACFEQFLEDYQAKNGREYDGLVMCCNECDQLHECAESPEQVADIIIGIFTVCPGCKLAGPGYSKADDGQKAAMAWIWVYRKCAAVGLCDRIRDGLIAHQPHYFLDHTDRTIDLHLDEFCDFMEGEVIIYRDDEDVERVRRKPDGVMSPCKHPLWPTVGRLSNSVHPPEAFGEVVRRLEARPDVGRYFIFSIYSDNPGFDFMVNWADGEWRGLRPFGAAFLEGVQ